MEWTFSSPGPVEAHVEVPAGDVEVRPSPDGQVVVVLEPASGRARQLVESAAVTMSGDRLDVRVPSNIVNRGSVHCVITLPDTSSISYRTASADLRCTIELARLDARTASGAVSVPAVGGDVSLTSASGDLDCGEVGGRLTVKSASGDVRVQRLGAHGVVSLASGDVEVGELAGSLRVNTASGDVWVRRAGAGRVDANTASGDIAIGVAPGVGAHFDVTSISGEMQCGLPVEEAELGAAQLEIVCRTVSGDVRIGAAAQ